MSPFTRAATGAGVRLLVGVECVHVVWFGCELGHGEVVSVVNRGKIHLPGGPHWFEPIEPSRGEE
jgi:hypothetical protein